MTVTIIIYQFHFINTYINVLSINYYKRIITLKYVCTANCNILHYNITDIIVLYEN